MAAPLANPSPPGVIELVLQARRTTTVTLLVAIPLACWAWIVVMARDMYGPMTGASRWMMTPIWDLPHLLMLWTMWAVMMTGMMLPSAAPLILLYGAAIRRRAPAEASRNTVALAAGYAVAWAGFSVGATLVQWALGETLLLSPMMVVTGAAAGASVLIAAGAYQFTPLKQSCLRACQSPLGFLMGRWREGWRGAFRLGLEHGMHCVGCCWALMLLLFVGGVMNLTVIVGLTVFVGVEKSGLLGAWGTRTAGALLIALGLVMLNSVL